MNTDLQAEAGAWLDQLYADLARDPQYGKSGEELLDRLEWEIRPYSPEIVRAVTAALEIWLTGPDPAKAEYAVDLIVRLGAVEYIPLLERLREELQAGRVSGPPLWLVNAALEQLAAESSRRVLVSHAPG